MSLLHVEDLSVTPPGARRPVVEGISFAVEVGGSLGLVGASGSGKTLTLLSLVGLQPAGTRVAGRAALGGEPLLGRPERAWRRIRGRRIGFVFQEPLAALTPFLPVGEQLAAVVRQHQGLSRAAARERAVDLLRAVELPDPAERARRYPHQLSGGQRQRVAIAAALAGDPDLLLADEPTTALDRTVQAGVLALLARLRRERGLALVLVGHDLAVVAAACEEVAVLAGGRLVERGPAASVLAAPRHPETAALVFGGAAPGPDGPAAEGDAAGGGGPSPGTPACGGAVAVSPVAEGDAAGGGGFLPTVAPLLAARGLVVRFPGRRGGTLAVDGVDLDLREREVVGLVGESGCGKTTLLRALARLVDPVAGAVFHRGREVTRLAGGELLPLRRDVQPVFQDAHAALDPLQTAGAAVAEGLRIHGLARGPAAAAAVEALFARCGLSPTLAGRYPHQLSAGERQRAGIARALAVEPRLLLADEPVASLDPPARARILDLFLSLRDESGLGLLLVSHDLAAVAAVADRVAVMYAGRLVETGPAAEVLGAPLHPYAAALVAAVPSLHRPVPASLPGEPDAPNPGGGCAFHPRCPRATSRCREEVPALLPASGDRRVACHTAAP